MRLLPVQTLRALRGFICSTVQAIKTIMNKGNYAYHRNYWYQDHCYDSLELGLKSLEWLHVAGFWLFHTVAE